MQKISIILSLIFAPLLLSYKYFYGVQTDSIFYIGAKLIPALLASIFFFVFLFSVLYNKYMILHFTQYFYKKELSVEEVAFLKNGDIYWLLITFINTLLQTLFAFFADDITWAFYSSVGWYIYFFAALAIQVLYGKFFILNQGSIT